MANLSPSSTREALRDQTTALITTVSALDDLGAPSLCRGWSRAHVLSHLARNAHGLARLVRAAHGETTTMYDSIAARDADIENGARRTVAEIREECISTASSVIDALEQLTPADAATVVERTPGGERFAAGNLPTMRLREVVFHHVDLDAGFTFADLPEELLDVLLSEELDRQLEPRTKAAALLWLARGILPTEFHAVTSNPVPTHDRPTTTPTEA